MMKVFLTWLRVKFKKEEGMEMLQVVLIAGLSLVLIVTIFYPAIQRFFESMMKVVTDWFAGEGSKLFK